MVTHWFLCTLVLSGMELYYCELSNARSLLCVRPLSLRQLFRHSGQKLMLKKFKILHCKIQLMAAHLCLGYVYAD